MVPKKIRLNSSFSITSSHKPFLPFFMSENHLKQNMQINSSYEKK